MKNFIASNSGNPLIPTYTLTGEIFNLYRNQLFFSIWRPNVGFMELPGTDYVKFATMTTLPVYEWEEDNPKFMINEAIHMNLGGEIKEYTEMLAEAREIALKRMEDKAKKIGADAVINVRFMTSAIMGGAAEILAYGTAVKLK